MSLRAPMAVPIEIRSPARRVFRLAWNVGQDGIRLARDASFEPGRPVVIRFALPEAETLAVRAEISGGEAENDELRFLDPPSDVRVAIRRYVHRRLGLPE